MDQYLQEQFIGKTFNDKLNNEIADYLQERKFSVLGFLPRPGAIAMAHVLDESGGIKAIGGSDPFDIINDNFGKWLAAMHSPISDSLNNPNMRLTPDPIDRTNTPRVVYYYNAASLGGQFWQTGGNGVSSIQIGSGVTAPDVSDFDIETPFIGGPEANNVTVVGNGGYIPGTGRVAIGTNIGAVTQAGTINEMCLFMTMPGGTFLFSHDAITPPVAFIIGETIFAQYFFQL